MLYMAGAKEGERKQVWDAQMLQLSIYEAFLLKKQTYEFIPFIKVFIVFFFSLQLKNIL